MADLSHFARLFAPSIIQLMIKGDKGKVRDAIDLVLSHTGDDPDKLNYYLQYLYRQKVGEPEEPKPKSKLEIVGNGIKKALPTVMDAIVATGNQTMSITGKDDVLGKLIRDRTKSAVSNPYTEKASLLFSDIRVLISENYQEEVSNAITDRQRISAREGRDSLLVSLNVAERKLLDLILQEGFKPSDMYFDTIRKGWVDAIQSRKALTKIGRNPAQEDV